MVHKMIVVQANIPFKCTWIVAQRRGSLYPGVHSDRLLKDLILASVITDLRNTVRTIILTFSTGDYVVRDDELDLIISS